MAALIDDLLDLSRISRSRFRKEPVDLTDIAAGVIAELRRTDPSREVAVEIETGLEAAADARLIRILLENLLGNSWKFTSKREAARIAFGRDKQLGDAVFFVRDNGAGLDMAYAGKLFAPFQRLHRASEFEGTGIGLATSSRIISRHGGRIWCDSAVNQGATFFFTLERGRR
jgi:light-regulated signal transduction histidine kinase (bacteriophytochrome)